MSFDSALCVLDSNPWVEQGYADHHQHIIRPTSHLFLWYQITGRTGRAPGDYRHAYPQKL